MVGILGSKSAQNSRQTVAIHLHPDFQDELFELLEVWNGAQSYLQFVPLRPPRNQEAVLLSKKVLKADEALTIATEIRKEDEFERNDGIVLFCEGRLHDEETYQLFSITWPHHIRGLVQFSTLSLRMMRVLAQTNNAELTKAPIFAMVIQQLLFALGVGAGLNSHNLSRACIMDYCGEMSDIALGLKVGPKFCPQCTGILNGHKFAHLLTLSSASRALLTPAMDRQVAARMQLRQERYSDAAPGKYQVAISFAGEDRQEAAALADALKKLNISVFYDTFEKETLWGADLYSYLSDLYRIRSEYCVMFLSRYYAKKVWTNHERKAAQARAFEDSRTYILPIRLDDTEVSGILPTVGYLRWDDETPASIATLISKKLNGRGVASR
jgi:hypothetical protein